MIDLPEGVEAAPVETFEDVTGELSRLIEPAQRPRRHTTQPPPLPRPSRPPERDTDLIGDWHVGFELGRGGMSTVYAVSHREFGKRAALKLSHTEVESSLGARTFHREARVVQLIEHPAMPDVFGTGLHDGRPYLVMERLRGENLTQRLARGQLPRERAYAILLAICDVLEAAHQAGVVHRDLKLDNVFILDEATARLKLLDWGFAWVANEEDPLRHMIAGTLGYVAPEQVVGGPISPATDVYALGVVAYRLLLGQSPFSADSDVELVCRHLRATPPHPALLWPGIPQRLADTLVAMLAKEALCRPSLGEVRAVLQAVLARPRRLTLGRGIAPVKPTIGSRALGVVTAIVCAIAGAAAVLT